MHTLRSPTTRLTMTATTPCRRTKEVLLLSMECRTACRWRLHGWQGAGRVGVCVTGRAGRVRDPDGGNELFVKSSRRKGLLPTVLEDLISARKRAKADLKTKTYIQARCDRWTVAGPEGLKISANSVYGFTGATISLSAHPFSTLGNSMVPSIPLANPS
ncbi:uncharacterized protein EV420DRAFT_1508883 [Desarmillaria tabescens]|uniref:DNA-directed DNA polymerase n=1 Tax=Armillaria tabescens TaxID=1929756 RepID=A0AA39NHW9_ARMTA|nr:uncharacterized protein EV420DRAFT_1508883 [Desarmillaria tabescens]KAK0465939.1 hypothetical protein EV420DRAFT_1508883 [Desarmillaria tabescens]